LSAALVAAIPADAAFWASGTVRGLSAAQAPRAKPRAKTAIVRWNLGLKEGSDADPKNKIEDTRIISRPPATRRANAVKASLTVIWKCRHEIMHKMF
jgi:hypothetical protein